MRLLNLLFRYRSYQAGYYACIEDYKGNGDRNTVFREEDQKYGRKCEKDRAVENEKNLEFAILEAFVCVNER